MTDVTDYCDEARSDVARMLRECACRLDRAEGECPGGGYAVKSAIFERLAEEVEPDE